MKGLKPKGGGRLWIDRIIMFGNIMVSLGATLLIMIFVEYVRYRLHNLTINKINKTIIQAFGTYYLDEEVNNENIKKFKVYVNQRLAAFKLDKRMSQFEIIVAEAERVKINYIYTRDNSKKHSFSYDIVKKETPN